MDMNKISNEMLAFQADLIHVREALNFYKNNIKTNLYNMPFSESSGIDSKIQLSC